ncbi:hypothetical protein D7Y09_00630 [bacterium 1XD42-1]|nr:hypothetical protein D7X25_01335 [bacterium 1XD42-8]RKJ67656.1 hypothetical protein D7Y09_00630 [bacterium 1XD42-1]
MLSFRWIAQKISPSGFFDTPFAAAVPVSLPPGWGRNAPLLSPIPESVRLHTTQRKDLSKNG